MNENTLVVVCCYAGDKEQVEQALPVHLAHKRPILVLSPEDSRVIINHPMVECRSGGKRGYFGQESLDRQRIYMEMMLETEHEFFLLNDADSMCLSAAIPRYLYEGAKDTVWSNVVREGRPHKSPYPKVAFHPPYFLARETIEKMLAVGPIEAHPITPFVDWAMVAMTAEAHLKYKSFPNGRSFVAWRHGDIPTTMELGHDYKHEPVIYGGRDGGKRMKTFVERGVVMVHSVKHKAVLDTLRFAHDHFLMTGSPDDLAPEPLDYSGVSLIVPFREDSSGTRTATWKWLEAFYREHLPEAEIVIGRDDGMPYSKSVAVNEAASRARGYILVIMDADVLIDPEIIRNCVSEIEKSPRAKWFIPFTTAHRLNREKSNQLQATDPTTATTAFTPTKYDCEDAIEGAPGFIHILSRRAFDRVEGYDPRFRGWGGEDTSFKHAVDTLYGSHTRLPSHIVHLWHERPGAGSSSSRRWDGQTERKRELWREYNRATGDRKAMRKVIGSQHETSNA